MLRVTILAATLAMSASLRIRSSKVAAPVTGDFKSMAAKQAFVTAALCTSILSTTPANAMSLNEAIVEVSETSYPIIKALSPEKFPPFTEKVGNLLLAIPAPKLGKSLELGIDLFNSVEKEKVDAFTSVVKEAYIDLKPEACTLVPLPPAQLADKFQQVAKDQVDGAKLTAFSDKWGGPLQALPKTASSICLPSVSALNKLALEQAELGRAFKPEESARFVSYTTPVLKQAITISKVLPLVNDAKALAPGASSAEKAAFQAAGKRIEAASKQEAMRLRQEQSKARSAALAEAKASGKPIPSSASSGAATKAAGLSAEERANQKAAFAEAEAARVAALQAKAAAKAQEAADKRAAYAEADAARLAELKAKSAAVREAKAAK